MQHNLKMLAKVLVLAALIGVAYAAQCGSPAVRPNLSNSASLHDFLSGKSTGRILGGVEATPHSWPWMVSFSRPGGGHNCGGSIINNEWILTAAHCFPNNYDVLIGAHSLTDPNVKKLKFKRVISHPNYNGMDYDIAVGQLSEPLEFNEHVSPVCLGDIADGRAGQRCFATGWGWSDDNGNGQPGGPDKLRQVDLTMIGHAECDKFWGGLGEETICAQGPRKDVCSGDSGGPLVCQDANGIFKHVGLTSYGTSCPHIGNPGVYARTSFVLDWIANTISS